MIKGGTSNWRGPVWFPMSFLMIETLRKLGKAYGPTFCVRLPGSPDRLITVREMAELLANRLIGLFTRQADGRRIIYGDYKKFHEDPHWRDHLLFYEYFNADTGVGLGASHQTGWTALVASLIEEWRR